MLVIPKDWSILAGCRAHRWKLEAEGEDGISGPLKCTAAWLGATALNRWSPAHRSSDSAAHAGMFWLFAKSWFRRKGGCAAAPVGSELCSSLLQDPKLTTFLKWPFKIHLKKWHPWLLVEMPKSRCNTFIFERADKHWLSAGKGAVDASSISLSPFINFLLSSCNSRKNPQ